MKVLLMALLLILLFPKTASPIDLDSFCHGFCSIRYQDGILRKGKCGCIDYYTVRLNGVLTAPKRARTDFADPAYYDGVDEMHLAPSE